MFPLARSCSSGSLLKRVFSSNVNPRNANRDARRYVQPLLCEEWCCTWHVWHVIALRACKCVYVEVCVYLERNSDVSTHHYLVLHCTYTHTHTHTHLYCTALRSLKGALGQVLSSNAASTGSPVGHIYMNTNASSSGSGGSSGVKGGMANMHNISNTDNTADLDATTAADGSGFNISSGSGSGGSKKPPSAFAQKLGIYAQLSKARLSSLVVLTTGAGKSTVRAACPVCPICSAVLCVSYPCTLP
jgi:hypothetical protein